MGQAIEVVPPDTFHQEMNRWGVVDLFVWSDPSVAYLASDSRYRQVWTDGTWTQFRRDHADAREVTVTDGEAALRDRFVGGARVRLTGATIGDTVVVRTHFHPSWTAQSGSQPVHVREVDGQLAFDAPCVGDCDVQLTYPRRQPLLYLALVVWIAGMFVVARWPLLRTGSR